MRRRPPSRLSEVARVEPHGFEPRSVLLPTCRVALYAWVERGCSGEAGRGLPGGGPDRPRPERLKTAALAAEPRVYATKDRRGEVPVLRKARGARGDRPEQHGPLWESFHDWVKRHGSQSPG